MRNSDVWYWSRAAPTNARFALLKRGLASAEGSIRARPRTWRGILEESESRAWRAASFAEYRARSGGGDGSGNGPALTAGAADSADGSEDPL